MTKRKILVVLRHSLCPEAMRMLAEVGEVSVAPRFVSEDELADLAKDCTGIILGGNRFGRDVIEKCKKLKVVSRHG
ncbi:MAG: hypothetical protein QXF24_07435, partial [Thermoproteota archaeon]